MTLTEKLRNLCLAGIAAVTLSGCSDEQYHFNGRIGNEYVVFYESFLGTSHFLKVKRPDGTVITYEDWNFPDDPDKVIIKFPQGQEKEYNSRNSWEDNNWTKPIFYKAQTEYSSYLTKILDAKIKEGIDLVSGAKRLE